MSRTLSSRRIVGIFLVLCAISLFYWIVFARYNSLISPLDASRVVITTAMSSHMKRYDALTDTASSSGETGSKYAKPRTEIQIDSSCLSGLIQ